MRKELLTSVCALSLLFGASTAFAGAYGEPVQPEEAPAAPPAPAAVVEVEEVDYARVGPYIGIGGNFAIENFNHANNVDNSTGFHVKAGYRVHPNVAVEARYENYLNFEQDPGQGSYDGWSATANVKGFFLTGRWQPYALFGMGYLDMSYPGKHAFLGQGGSHNPHPGGGFAMRYGIGMQANITENIAIGPEIAYVLPVGEVANFDMITIALGLQYNF